METQNIKGTITQSKEGKLTLRIWLNDAQKRMFCLEDGKTRSFDEDYGSVIIMPSSGDELTKTKRQVEAEKHFQEWRAEKLAKDSEYFNKLHKEAN